MPHLTPCYSKRIVNFNPYQKAHYAKRAPKSEFIEKTETSITKAFVGRLQFIEVSIHGSPERTKTELTLGLSFLPKICILNDSLAVKLACLKQSPQNGLR